MTRTILQNEAKNIAEILARRYKPEKIIAFGSVAEGKVDRDSDIDLFVIKKTQKTLQERIFEAGRLLDTEWPHTLPLDLIIYTPQEVQARLKMGDFFVRSIIEEGKVLYEAESSRSRMA